MMTDRKASGRAPSLATMVKKTGQKIDFFKRNALARRLRLVERAGIDLCLDVGANTGQWARSMRKAGYRGQIISFEPLAGAFTRLARSASRDGCWRAVQMGLGSRDHEMTLHVSGYSQSSSLKKMLPLHEDIASYFSQVSEERVTIRKLDSVWSDHVPAHSKVYLKIDTQGFEKQVLDGAVRSLPQVRAVQMEISIVPLYEGTLLLPDALRIMARKGFTLVSLEYGFCHPETGQMLQVDGLFARE
jgi:FkbM family methyltransferase